MLPHSDDRFDQELAGWFSLRGGAWSGTAAELLTSVRTRSDDSSRMWPQSSRGLYDHLTSHRQMLRSLGVEVLLHHGVPRMVSLRSCQNELSPRKPPSDGLEIDRSSDPPANPSSLVDGQKASLADAGDAGLPAREEFVEDIPTAKSGVAGHDVSRTHATGDKFEGGVFKNTGESLVAIGEMRQRIREQGLDLESAVGLAISCAQQITRSCGIAVGFLPEQGMGRPLRTGSNVSIKGLHFDVNLFPSSLMAGQAVQLRDAQKHPLLGARCQREGIGSLIIVPIFRSREVAGVMEFLFQETRFFSPGDVMDLGLIAGAIGESLGSSAQVEGAQEEGRGCPQEAKTIKDVEPRAGQALHEKVGPGDHLPKPVGNAIDAETGGVDSSTQESMVLGSLASTALATAPTLLWRAFKRAWIRHPRGM